MKRSEDKETKPSAKPTTPLWGNTITMIGVFVAVSGLILLLTFGLFSIVSPASNPYVDIVGYLVIPGIMAVGVGLMPVGILFRSWRLRRKDPTLKLAFRFPRIDLNDPKQRRTAMYLAGVILLLLPVVGVSSYHGYHYTDSTEFCAKACHAVMEPQAVAYETSPHARVTCAECHIGSGASWFVKSKISGTRQVLAVLTDSFNRPIPPAIHHLRPAADTCEQCHWPEKFFGAQLREIVHFASDEENTRREVKMLVKTGGGDQATGRIEGIHMHMTLAGDIEYVATDDRLQEIPWVKWTQSNGTELVYRSDGRTANDPPPAGLVRTIDCMDCHNRPAHKFRSPDDAVDLFMATGRIDPSLPYVKRESVAALVEPQETVRSAHAHIANSLTEYYRETHPEVWAERKADVEKAIAGVQEVYRRNFFPEMRVDWQTYPDNIGHMNSPGCFRCHDGNHVNQFGDAISHECHVCHTFLNPVEGDNGIIREGEFSHPYEPVGVHAALRCDQCHAGGPIDPTCTGCHASQQGLYTASAPALRAYSISPDPMADYVDCESCHDLSEPRSIAAIDEMCMDCHEAEEEKYAGMLERWVTELDSSRRAAESAVARVRARQMKLPKKERDAEAMDWLTRTERALDLLQAANPVHNHAASTTVYDRIMKEASAYAP